MGESHGVNDWERISKYRIDVQIYSYDEYDDMTCTAWVTFQKDSPRSVVWSSPRGIDCNSGESGV